MKTLTHPQAALGLMMSTQQEPEAKGKTLT